MKKIILTLLSLTLFFSAFSGNADLFNFDQDKIISELQDLTNLEVFLENNSSITYLDLQNSNSNLINNISGFSKGFGFFGSEPALGIPSFLWGCVLGWVGILVVYLVTEDNNETKSALYGCITQGCVVGAFYIVYFVLILGSTTYY